MSDFEALRKRFLGQGFHKGMWSLLSKLDRDGEAGLEGWLDATGEAAKMVKRSPGFWIELLLQDLGPVPEEAADGRVLDVQGWLELLHEPAEHLVICGMNEGRVPARGSTDTWLPENAREALGLPCEASRAARDAYLLNALLQMRAWSLEDHWKWKPREVEPRTKMSVTAFSKYLACPFRYYLQGVVGMYAPEPERVEWNHRDFGSVMHDVLEQWGRDEKARDSAEVKEFWIIKRRRWRRR